MKKNFTIILLGILFLSCSSDDDLNDAEANKGLGVSKEIVNLGNIEGSATINVTSGTSWNAAVENGSDWISLSPSSGNGNGSIRIMATDNTDGDTRGGKIKISQSHNGSTVSKEVEVNQLGANPDILISYPTDIFPADGGDLTVSVTSNIEWEVYIEETYNWISISGDGRTKAMVTEECILKITPNSDLKRTGKAIIRSKGDYVVNRVVEITQEKSEAFLSLEQDEFVLPYKLETLIVPVDLGEHITQYRVSTTEDWVTWDEEASTSSQIVLKLKNNDQSDFPRITDVTITNVNLTETVTLFQYGKPNPRIGDDLNSSVLAFPGAEGGGRFTTGGRGGEIYRVTNLEDYGNKETPILGSLRYGIEKSAEPRTIIFDVSGIIELKRGLFLADHPNISIIGQTAPGDGITLKNYNFSFNLSQNSKEMNAIIRFLRFRPGDRYEDYAEDAIGGRYFTNAIVDHVTASWGVDETFSFYGCQNFTAQWCIASESLNFSNHAKGAHGYGAMFSGDNASFHHILLAHHGSRCPRISDMPEPGTEGAGDHIGYFDVRNNVYYNWSEAGFGSYGGKYGTFNIVDCYYKAGPATGTGSMSWRVLSSDPTARAYIEGNHVTESAEVTSDNWTNGIWSQFWRDLNPTEQEMQAMKMTSPQPFSKVTNHTAEQAYEKVLKYAGASLRRDIIDQRIINEVKNKTSSYTGSRDTNPRPGIIDTVNDTEGYPEIKSLKAWPDTDGDGIPDIWEDAYGLDKNNPSDANSFTIDNTSRYSNLEVYFHNLVQHIVYYQNEGGIVKEKK